jgi:hypothetical protein
LRIVMPWLKTTLSLLLNKIPARVHPEIVLSSIVIFCIVPFRFYTLIHVGVASEKVFLEMVIFSMSAVVVYPVVETQIEPA